MSDDIVKTYDPASVEARAYQVWLDEKCFSADPNAPGEPYCIVIPPPNVTGALHLGHAINNTLQDILIRAHRMRGFNALWIPGIDHAGIATQAVVEKQLKEKENKTRHDVGREELVRRIWAWKEQYGDRILEQLKRMGSSCDWDRSRFTLDEPRARAVRETFFKLFKDGLIYRGKRLVNWDVQLQTSISDDEIYHETVKTSMWHVRYPIAGTDKFMVVATTRPETMLGDTAVAVHSQDSRWNWAIGKSVDLPLTGRQIPIIADDILVDPKFGSGVVKVTPAHDPNDYAVWQRHQNQPDQIDILNILNPDGTIHDNGGNYKGMKRDAARKKVVEDLTSLGLLEKEDPYETQVGHSDRSKTAIEPYLSDQWFVKMAPLAEPALEVVRRQIIKFFPERHARQYLSWLGEKRDWVISRQLWWGHRIPVWIFLWSGPRADESSDSQQVRMDLSYLTEKQNHQIAVQVIRPGIDGKILVGICVRPGHPEIEKLIEKHGGQQDPDVLDTWFSSALWPHSTLGWPDDTPDLRKWYPTSVLVTSREIITLWVVRMVVTGLYNMGRAPSFFSPGTRGESQGEVSPRPDATDEVDLYLIDFKKDAGFKTYAMQHFPHARVIAEASDRQSAVSVLQRIDQETGRRAQMFQPFKSNNLRMYEKASGKKLSPAILIVDKFQEFFGKDDKLAQDATLLLDRIGRQGRTFGVHLLLGSQTIGAVPGFQDWAKELGVPFHHVCIHTTILDGHGERMSKSKGNGVDPVDVIDTHGADALRFTLAQMATETQDVRLPVKKDAQGRNTSDKFDVGSRFCNKIWQVAQFFVIPNLQKISPEPVNETKWSLADRWIVSRFNRAMKDADDALAVYRFDQYAKICYDFFYGDFCDWYVEAAKPLLKNPATAPQTAGVLAAVLDGSLRLMHPMIPFITETIWWRLNEVRPRRGLPGSLASAASLRLIKAAWPAVGPFSDAAESGFSRLQELISAIRKLRNDYKVDAKKPVDVSILAPGELSTEILASRVTIELLATCRLKDASPTLAPLPSAARAPAAGCDIFVEGLVDEGAEKQRIAKRTEELTRQIATLKARLTNDAYLAKAPSHLVRQTKDQLTQAEIELKKLTLS